MIIYGVDFTCAPKPGKPITCARCDLQGGVLHLEAVELLADSGAFAALLDRPGPWVAGFDFPFGQPRKLAENLSWPGSWAGYVAQLGGLAMDDFAALLKQYRDARPAGDKQHPRRTDALAGARSPMMMHGVPVGRMFLRGAPLLLRSVLSLLTCNTVRDDRIALEVYPGLVARRWIGRRSYKSDTRSKQATEQMDARCEIVAGLRRSSIRDVYGVVIDLTEGQASELVQDPKGDALDALLGALPAAWAYGRRDRGWGVPPDADPLEGWIVDPSLL